MKEFILMYIEGSLLFFFFLEGLIVVVKRCDYFVLEWNFNFLNFYGGKNLRF